MVDCCVVSAVVHSSVVVCRSGDEGSAIIGRLCRRRWMCSFAPTEIFRTRKDSWGEGAFLLGNVAERERGRGRAELVISCSAVACLADCSSSLGSISVFERCR